MIRHLCCEGMSQITIIQRLCYTVHNVFMLQLCWILAAIGRTCLFGVREPMSPHLNPSFDRKDSVLSVYASLTQELTSLSALHTDSYLYHRRSRGVLLKYDMLCMSSNQSATTSLVYHSAGSSYMPTTWQDWCTCLSCIREGV